MGRRGKESDGASGRGRRAPNAGGAAPAATPGPAGVWARIGGRGESLPWAAWPPAAIATAFFLSGASAIVYELLWFRMLGHIFGSTATATSTLLAAYLFGLGLGAWIFGRLSDRMGRLATVYVVVEAAIGLFGLASHALFERGAALYAAGHSWAAGSAGSLLLARFAVSFVLVAIPTTLMGGTFPLMVHLLKGARVDVGRAAGRAYAINTAGAALGALSLPAFLLPGLGVGVSLAVAAAGNFAAAGLALAQLTFLAPGGAAAGEEPGASPQVPAPDRAVPLPASRPSDPRTGDASPGTLPQALAAADAEPGSVLQPPPALRPATGDGGSQTAPRPAAAAGAPSGRPASAPRGAAQGDRFGSLSPALALLAGFFLSSFAALALENVWTRHLGFFFGAQTWTFAFVLFAYLVGLFLGGAVYARLIGAGFAPVRLYRWGLLLSALSVALPIPFLDRLAVPQIELLLRMGISYGNFLFTSGLVTVALILLPALGFGIVFPAVIDLLARGGRRTGASVAVTYVVNTAGTTLGALAAGFVLIPVIGSQRTLELCVLLTAGAYALSWAMGDEHAQRASNGLRYGVPAAFLLLLILPRWDWVFAHGQYSKDPVSFLEKYRSGALWSQLANYKIPYLEEGTEATVSVCRLSDGYQILYVNGKPDASDYRDDMVAQRLLACVPGLFHPAPKRALVIGVGSGTTVGTLKRFPLESIDAAEISPEVGEAAGRFFTKINDGFLSDPRVRLHLDDGRNFLHFQPPASYDIIISEPSNPWMAGVSALFTDEFFAEVKARLRPGGIFCQWFHYYNMSVDHIRLLARTYHRHFPQAAMFVLRGANPTGDIILIGSNAPLRLQRLPDDPTLPEGVRAALAEVQNAGTQHLLGGLIAAPENLAEFARLGPVNTDDLPILEFTAPSDKFGADFLGTLKELLTFSERTFLPAGPLPEQSPASKEIALDGFELPRGLPEGQEVRRGVTVLTRFRQGGEDLSRWALTGREFESGEAVTGLYKLRRPLARPDEFVDIATSLAGGGELSRLETKVNGHVGIAVVADSTSRRTMVLGWNCPFRNQAFFVSRSVPRGGPPPGPEAVADLAGRYPCSHPAGSVTGS